MTWGLICLHQSVCLVRKKTMFRLFILFSAADIALLSPSENSLRESLVSVFAVKAQPHESVVGLNFHLVEQLDSTLHRRNIKGVRRRRGRAAPEEAQPSRLLPSQQLLQRPSGSVINESDFEQTK